ncbi:MAG: rRNA methyltransferase [Alphaproteobacteria bacterium]|nr:rRNA methyltransferase [Alphaproteobacteria bacterium]
MPHLRQEATRLKNARSHKPSSQRWLQRQLNDPYVTAAKREGYRSRAAWKILQLDEKHRLLRPGMRVVDLGAAPGGWSQVVSAKIGARGRLVALDILPMDPLPDVILFEADFMAEDSPQRLMDALEGPADLVLSDMAAGTTGHSGTDHIRIMLLAEAAYEFARDVLAPGGTFVCKLFLGGAEKELQQQLRRDFRTVKYVKPPSSRKESAETYLVAQGYRKR